jgi:Ca2+-binding EF-hand superfamily protein
MTTTTQKIQVPSNEECLALWDRIDYNGNGMLSLAELDKAVIEIWPEFNHKPAIMRAYKAADKNDDGFIRRNEFRRFLKYLELYNNLWDDFSSIDNDNDRRLTKGEFEKMAPKLDISNPEEVWKQMDVNQGGVVLFDEFCAWMSENSDS